MFPYLQIATALQSLLAASEPKAIEQAVAEVWRLFDAAPAAPADSRLTAGLSLLSLAARLSGPGMRPVPAASMSGSEAIDELRQPECGQAVTIPAGMNPLPIVFALSRTGWELIAADW